MIVFDKLWETMKKRGVSQYKLIHTYGISTGLLDRLRKNGSISTYTIDNICKILDCRVEEIMEYAPDPDTNESDEQKRQT